MLPPWSYHETGGVHIRAQWSPRGLFLQSSSCHPETPEGFRNGPFTALPTVWMEVPVLRQTPLVYKTPIDAVSTKALGDSALLPVGGAFSLRVWRKSLANTAVMTLWIIIKQHIIEADLIPLYKICILARWYKIHSVFYSYLCTVKNKSRFPWKCRSMHRSLICL